jgi:hypothetical protein
MIRSRLFHPQENIDLFDLLNERDLLIYYRLALLTGSTGAIGAQLYGSWTNQRNHPRRQSRGL